jgi:hypothetical protein
MRRSVLIRSLAVAALLLAPAATSSAGAGPTTARYAGAGVAVVRADGSTPVDNGFVACDSGDGVGSGGACLPFGGGDGVHVVDDARGEDVAFQVCVDNDGDGLCTSGNAAQPCGDDIVFSHDDAGNFFNPVGPVPAGFRSGCPGGPWRGYVVFLCEGAHASPQDPGATHAHPATTGTAAVTSGAEGVGTFCGGSAASATRPAGKPYVVTSGVNLTCGFDTRADDTPDGLLGGQNVYNGTVTAGPWHVAGASSVQILCSLRVNGANQGVVLTGSTGVNAAYVPASRLTFTAAQTDVVTLCTNVSWTGGSAGSGTYVRCADATSPSPGTLVVPQEVV